MDLFTILFMVLLGPVVVVAIVWVVSLCRDPLPEMTPLEARRQLTQTQRESPTIQDWVHMLTVAQEDVNRLNRPRWFK